MLPNQENDQYQFTDNSKENSIVVVRQKPYKKRIILADANIPYNLSLDRNANSLFFCINADEFSDQSFHSVILNLDNGMTSVIPGVRNGFASAVDIATSTVYLGGSDGIYKFNYDINDVDTPSILGPTDIFDMYFHKNLYFVDTALQNLHVINNSSTSIVSEVKGSLIHHFVFDRNDDLFFINASGLYLLPKGAKYPVRQDNVSRDLNFRGLTTDAYNRPYFMAQDGIYSFDNRTEMVRILAVENGYGLAFDRENNIFYSDERTVSKLTPVEA